MCLSIPSKVVKIDKENEIATVDTMGVQRDASLSLMSEENINIGDYVLLHIGFVMNKIDETEALESLALYKEIIEAMNEEDRRLAILEAEKVNGEAREAALGHECSNQGD
ncbi:HypC/HybG/HupF family hydrogenase formation chaperone [Sulfurimonas sp.]|uniref:HypC/HybG/HupF family hydrogenase formation chaperone n=1 Tax=Sulfurimonas sp. TaxID=2022749 RepID=UPI00286E54E5|nr:HypC/HybG/HupF family hydrogenase formation chaperone [Sulfurimonas sp.]